MAFVYIVRCTDGTLYTGYAEDLARRVDAHNAGRGARYTAGRRPVALVYSESCDSRGAALRREHAIKQLSRIEKEALVRQAKAAARAARAIRKAAGGGTARAAKTGRRKKPAAGA